MKNNHIYIIFILFVAIFSHNLWAKTNSIYYEVEFTYSDIINGKVYTETADLLRNKVWLKQNNISKVGDTLVLSIPEFGVMRARATVVKLIQTAFNPKVANHHGSNMVTGKFMHYATDVRAYQLKDIKTGYLQTIKATPNHSFYVENRIAFNKVLNQYSHFIEIQNITPKDTLINESGDEVKLICSNGYKGNCEEKIIREKNKPIAVYNLEIYNKHQYLSY